MTDNSIYILLSKQTAALRHLEVVANNIANASTLSKKQQNILYQPFSLRDEYKNKMDFANDIMTYRNIANGAIRKTDNSFDLAIMGEGYFAVQTPEGIHYSRAGNFKLNQDGQLSSFDDLPILDKSNRPIIFQANDTDITIDERGFIRSATRDIGQLELVRFNNDNSLSETGNNRFTTNETPMETQNFKIIQFALEDSNIDSIGQITNMMSLQQNTNLTKNIMDILEQIEQKSIDDLTRTVKG